MANRQKLRDAVAGEIDAELIRERQATGWRLVALEWERELEGSIAENPRADVPFGFRVAGDCKHLEEHPEECEILRTVMKGVVNDRPLSQIASELNTRGYRTRAGAHWNPASVFRLMPDLVNNGPRIFSDPEWPAMRHA